MIKFQVLEEMVEPFYEKNGCLSLALNEYRRYRICSRDAGAINLHRFSPRMERVCCATWDEVDEEIDIYEFNEDTESWSSSKVVRFDIGPFSGCVYVSGKLFAFSKISGGISRHETKVTRTIYLLHN